MITAVTLVVLNPLGHTFFGKLPFGRRKSLGVFVEEAKSYGMDWGVLKKEQSKLVIRNISSKLKQPVPKIS